MRWPRKCLILHWRKCNLESSHLKNKWVFFRIMVAVWELKISTVICCALYNVKLILISAFTSGGIDKTTSGMYLRKREFMERSSQHTRGNSTGNGPKVNTCSCLSTECRAKRELSLLSKSKQFSFQWYRRNPIPSPDRKPKLGIAFCWPGLST